MSFAQVENRFGFEIGSSVPDIAFQFRGKIKLIEPLDFEFGIDLNKSNTLGRTIGFNYHLGNWESLKENKIRSILIGMDYSHVSSGVVSYRDGTISGSYLIQSNQYFSPKIGFRIYQKEVFKEYLVLRDGVASPTISEMLIKQAEGGINIFFRMTTWF